MAYKKDFNGEMNVRRSTIEQEHSGISVARQCELVGLARSSLYYQPAGETDENLLLMRLMDEEYTRRPFYGYRKMTAWLNRQGYGANHKRVERLMQEMGIAAIYPGPRLSKPAQGHHIYPYLLRG